MRKPLVSSLLLGLVVAHAALAPAARAQAPAPTKKGEPGVDSRVAPALKARGFVLQKVIETDFDGDGTRDFVAAATNDGGAVQLVVLTEAKAENERERPKLVVKTSLPPAGGKQVKSLEAKDLYPPKEAMEVILEVYDETPDEKVKRVRVYAGAPKPREIFTNVIFRPKNADDREEWEREKNVVQFGDARAGWYFQDLENDGLTEILVRRKPQLLTVPVKGGESMRLLTGVREAVYAFEGGPDAGVYKERKGEHFNDFLPALNITDVTGSSVFVEPQVMAELKAKSVAEQLEQGNDPKAKKNTDDPKIDLSPFYKLGADRDLNTAWIEGAKDDGSGEHLDLRLPEESAVHMVRVVAGCVESKSWMSAHNTPVRFKVRLGERGMDAAVDRNKPNDPDSPAIAVLELPIKDRPWAKQTLVFFDGREKANLVRITLDKVVRAQGTQASKANQTCVSEVSVH